MSEKKNETQKAENSTLHYSMKTGLRAGMSCPEGWWKEGKGRNARCCQYAWDPYYRTYRTRCQDRLGDPYLN